MNTIKVWIEWHLAGIEHLAVISVNAVDGKSPVYEYAAVALKEFYSSLYHVGVDIEEVNLRIVRVCHFDSDKKAHIL